MPRLLYSLLIVLSFCSSTVFAQSDYYPPFGEWERKAPEEMGFDPQGLQQAIDFVIANENPAPKDLEKNHYLGGFGREPFGYGVGPFKTRGPATGLIIKDGYIVADWGQPDRVDMTFSVTKTFLSSTVGLAYDRGM
ncbi:MAG: serine hydrolase, partial [Bacteroidota bacterium]